MTPTYFGDMDHYFLSRRPLQQQTPYPSAMTQLMDHQGARGYAQQCGAVEEEAPALSTMTDDVVRTSTPFNWDVGLESTRCRSHHAWFADDRMSSAEGDNYHARGGAVSSSLSFPLSRQQQITTTGSPPPPPPPSSRCVQFSSGTRGDSTEVSFSTKKKQLCFQRTSVKLDSSDFFSMGDLSSTVDSLLLSSPTGVKFLFFF